MRVFPGRPARTGRWLTAVAAVTMLAATACRRAPDLADAAIADGAPATGGTMVISIPSDADVLIPPLSINPTGSEVDALLFDRLAEPDSALNTIGDVGFTPRLARSWTWSHDSLAIAFHLDPRARWHDGVPVRAGDVRFTFRLYTDSAVGSPVAPLLAGVDSVTTPDSLTATFWFSRRWAEQFFTAAYEMRILPEHALRSIPPARLATSAFARHPIGDGPFRFVRWVPGSSIELDADTSYYRGRPHLDRLIWSIAPDYNTAVVRLFSGEADFIEYLRPEDLTALRAHADLQAVRIPSLTYIFLLFNERNSARPGGPNPIFGDVRVRRALSMAVDRPRLVENVLGRLGEVSLGPVPAALRTYDPTLPQIPFAPDSARALLDRAGWRMSPRGVRAKNGRPLQFTIIVPQSSTPRLRMAVLLQAMFRAVGARVHVQQLENVTMEQRLRTHHFDAAMSGFQVDPSPSTIRQLWTTRAARSPDGSNWGGYESSRFDALVDSAVAALDPAAARRYYRRAYATIVADAPAVWLYEPVEYAGMQRRIHPVGLRADGWWGNLADWYIPAGERAPRDLVGLAATH